MNHLQRARRVLAAAVMWGALAVSGCGGNTSTVFPPGLMPITGVDAVSPPAATATSMYPQVLSATSGALDSNNYVHAQTYIDAPLTQVIAAMLTPAVFVDRRNVNSFTVDQMNEPGYEYTYLIHNMSDNIVTVEFDLQFRLAVVAGTDANPTTFVAVYQKVYGTTFIDFQAGSVVATAVTPNVTLLDMVREQHSYEDDDPSYLRQYLQDFTNSLIAQIQGNPLPTY